jgi:hypothetical protein
MALSNIFREPPREITESAVGIGVFGGLIFLDSYFANWLHAASAPWGPPLALCYLFGLFFAIALWVLALFTHIIGEEICGALANRGLELRPKRRH